MDVVAKERLREFITEINRERGVTVLLTTHDVVDMEKLVSRVIVIHAGQIIYDGSMTGLRERYGGEDADIEDIVRKIYREGERTA